MKKLLRKCLYSALHAIILLILSWFCHSYLPWQGDAKLWAQVSSILKDVVLDNDHPPKGKLMFVDVSTDLALRPLAGNNGYETITNRASLAWFFGYLRQHPQYYRYVLCNLAFTHRSDTTQGDPLLKKYFIHMQNADSLLKQHLAKMKNLVYATDTKTLNDTVFPGKKGYTSYSTKTGDFFHFRLMESPHKKSLPLLMYENLHQQKMQQGWFYYLNGKLAFNKQVIDFKVRNKHLDTTTYYGGTHSLASLQLLARVGYLDRLFEAHQKPIIVIGNFSEQKKVNTVVGKVSGALILLNVFLGLEGGSGFISFWLVLLLLVVFFITSWLAFYRKPKVEPNKTPNEGKKKKQNTAQKYLKKLFISSAILTLSLGIFTIICFEIFQVHLNVFFIILYVRYFRYFRNLKLKECWNKQFNKKTSTV